jgi:hypothetical protein
MIVLRVKNKQTQGRSHNNTRHNEQPHHHHPKGHQVNAVVLVVFLNGGIAELGFEVVGNIVVSRGMTTQRGLVVW